MRYTRCPTLPLLLASTVTVLLVSVAPAHSGDQQAVFDLIINTVAHGEIPIVLRGKDILLRVKDLQQAGLQAIAGRQETIKGERYVSLESLAPEIHYQANPDQFTIELTVQATALPTTTRDLRPNLRPDGIRYTQDSSLFINYALSTQDFKQISGSSEIGLSLGSSLLYSNLNLTPNGHLIRGLTNLTIDNRNNQTRWSIGDRFINTGDLGGGALLGGISYTSERSLDPYVVRSPTTDFSGIATTPSTADIYVNNQLVRREILPPGPFELRNLPLSTGSNDARVVLRDSFGREQQYTYSSYRSPQLLRQGESEFGYGLGFQRNNFSTDSWNYGSLAFLGYHRIGLSKHLTLGGRLEATRDLVSGGVSLATDCSFGEFGLNLATSQSAGGSGSAASFSFATSGKSASFNTSVRLMSPHYANLGLAPSDDRKLFEVSANASLLLGSHMTLFGRYSYANWRDQGRIEEYQIGTAASLSPKLSLSLSAKRSNQAQGTSSTDFMLTFNYSFDSNTTGSVSQEAGSRTTTTAQIQKSLPTSLSGVGYRLQSQLLGDRNNFYSQLQYQSEHGLYELNLDRVNQANTLRLTASGSIVWLDRHLLLGRPVQGSFALLEVPGLPGVEGYFNNQAMGKTNGQGVLLIPNLQAYYGNKISIVPDNLPLNYTLDTTEQLVAPPYRGGSVVRFLPHKVQAITGTIEIQQANQIVIPNEGQISVKTPNQAIVSPIGGQGQFYFENLAAGTYPATLESGKGSCQLNLTIPSSDQVIIKLGKLSCTLSSNHESSPSSSSNPVPSPASPAAKQSIPNPV